MAKLRPVEVKPSLLIVPLYSRLRAGNSEPYRISQSQLVVIALGDRGRNHDRRAVEYREQFLAFADILAGRGLHRPQIAVDRRGQPGAAAGCQALLLGCELQP